MATTSIRQLGLQLWGEISIFAVSQQPGNDHDRHAVCIKVADSH